jgi:S-adenosylmethionine hydrolase
MSIITLTTDFGYKDPFIGEMKGVILSINPAINIVDITHGITPFNIIEADFIISSSRNYFPPGTIHVVVVDPGVGTCRRPVIIETDDQLFVGPDNGIFTTIIKESGQKKCIHITNEEYMLSKDSSTFQGRDIFAPVAAWLSRGKAASDIGIEINDCIQTDIPAITLVPDGLQGEVVYIDQFGNAITNITTKDLRSFHKYSVLLKGHLLHPVENYARLSPGAIGCLINSSGHLEIFSFQANASQLFGIGKREKIKISGS